ncbi:hypothetical protein M5K25_012248 [Dendrobium thyrsiflorum]|uniref:Uncharacterized protein n=1 Tax=Dendrobium thyrsiflorum TaxID=117978 RepID=A0ABD0UWP6_DENTH
MREGGRRAAVKAKVDVDAAAGSPLDLEDIVLYTLHWLPAQYQAFKTAIRTNLQPLSLDDLYTLLCSQEQNVALKATHELHSLQLYEYSMALAASRGHGRRRFSYHRGCPPSFNKFAQPVGFTAHGGKSAWTSITCQICSKLLDLCRPRRGRLDRSSLDRSWFTPGGRTGQGGAEARWGPGRINACFGGKFVWKGLFRDLENILYG